MWVDKMVLKNIRGFEEGTVEFSKGINILVGPNNSGKSTIARAVLGVQQGFTIDPDFVRTGEGAGNISVYLEDARSYFGNERLSVVFEIQPHSFSSKMVSPQQTSIPAQLAVNKEPNNFIYPYLSKRKVVSFEEQINEEQALTVTGDLRYLYAKVDKVSNPEMPSYNMYVDACKKILGFIVTCSSSQRGKKACYIIDNFKKVPVDCMGEGVANVLGLLVDLCVAENKLFVIEEPENDIHPKALKELLLLIARKSSNNQFIITTHSNIVLKYLGAEESTKIFKVNMEFKKKIPTSTVEPIGNSLEARMGVLEELGYELADSDLFTSWLFLEESSAERIIRDYLVPWFAPSLHGKLRTYSARDKDEVELKFRDFNTLYSYLNLQPIYKNKAWLIIDAGNKEKEIIETLQSTYAVSGWKGDHFLQFGKHDFECYYPKLFADKVKEVCAMTNKKEKKEKKKALLEELLAWIKDNPEIAKDEFQNSAGEVVKILKTIESQVVGK